MKIILVLFFFGFPFLSRATGGRRPVIQQAATLRPILSVKKSTQSVETLQLLTEDFIHEVATDSKYRVLDETSIPLVSQLQVSPALESRLGGADPILLPVFSSPVTAEVSLLMDRLYYGVGEGPLREVHDLLSNSHNGNPLVKTSRIYDHDSLHVGLDLLRDFNADLLWVGSEVKKDVYELWGTARLKVQFHPGLRRAPQEISWPFRIYGAYFELSLSWLAFEAGLEISRRLALGQVLRNLAQQALQKLHNISMPGLVSVEERDGHDYVMTGREIDSIVPGMNLYCLTGNCIYEVENVFDRISLVRKSIESSSELSEVLLTDQIQFYQRPETQSFSIQLQNLALGRALDAATQAQNAQNPETSIQNDLSLPPSFQVLSGADRFLQGVKALVTLPYRLIRLSQYNQAYAGFSLAQENQPRLDHFQVLEDSYEQYQGYAELRRRNWGRRNLIIDLIGTGVDYNHRELKHNIYCDEKNCGHDYASEDQRSFDDHEQSTMMASLMVGGGWNQLALAPYSTLRSLKVTNPFGFVVDTALERALEESLKGPASVVLLALPLEVLKGDLLSKITEDDRHLWIFFVPPTSEDTLRDLRSASGVFVIQNLLTFQKSFPLASPRDLYRNMDPSKEDDRLIYTLGFWGGLSAWLKSACSGAHPSSLVRTLNQMSAESSGDVKSILSSAKAIVDTGCSSLQ